MTSPSKIALAFAAVIISSSLPIASSVTVNAATLTPSNLIATFVEGFLSFISPCVLPLVPGYLSFISGVAVGRTVSKTGASNFYKDGTLVNHPEKTLPSPSDQSLTSSKILEKRSWGATRRVVVATLAFITGFTIVFIFIFGLTYTLSNLLGADLRVWIQTLAGAVVIVMGLHFIGVFKIGLVNLEKRFHLSKANKPAGLLGAFLVGTAFAAGWSPCVGPFLGAALTSAIDSPNTWEGVGLMVIYSAGLGLPFLLAGLFMNRLLKFIARVQRHYQVIEIASGLLLVLVGLFIVTNNMTELTKHLARLQQLR